jgi:rhamnulokinase
MPAKNLLAFDLGAESGRALLGHLTDDGKLTLEEKHRFANPNGKINGHLHWNLLAQWEELKTGLRKAAAGTGSGNTPIHAIGVDTWGVDFGLLDSQGNLLANPFMYRDAQTDGMLEYAFSLVPKERIFEQTGIQFMQLNSLYQLLALVKRKPPLLDCADTLLFMPDLFNYLFTGEKVAEFSIATTSQMYDPRKRAWATELLKGLGVPVHVLPRIVASGTRLANLLPEVQQECGVGPIPVIATAGHDTASAVAAVPAQPNSADWCYISSGTWSLMGVEIDRPIINDKSLKHNYTNEGGVGGTIRFLKNIMGLWLVQECRRHWQKEGHDYTYAQLTQLAAAAKPFAAVIDPDHAPCLRPGDMPKKIADFCIKTGQTPPSTPGEFVRTCLEGLALTYRKTLEGLQDVLDRKVSTIHIVGGGSQNELLNQMTADACSRPVIAGPVEATAIGNMLITAMATGDVNSLADLRRIVRQSFETKHYDPRDTAKWDDAYARYRKLLTV